MKDEGGRMNQTTRALPPFPFLVPKLPLGNTLPRSSASLFRVEGSRASQRRVTRRELGHERNLRVASGRSQRVLSEVAMNSLMRYVVLGAGCGIVGCLLGVLIGEDEIYRRQSSAAAERLHAVIDQHREFRMVLIDETSGGHVVVGGKVPSKAAAEKLRNLLKEEKGVEWLETYFRSPDVDPSLFAPEERPEKNVDTRLRLP
jgi:hypothetical protein